jgi:hypothetical protein
MTQVIAASEMPACTMVHVPGHVVYEWWSALFARGVISSEAEPHTTEQPPEQRRAAELANLISSGTTADGSFTAHIGVATEIIAAAYGIDPYPHEGERLTHGTDGDVLLHPRR